MNRFKYTLLVSGLGSNMAERRAWAWICRCFTICFGRCRCWVSRSPPWAGTPLRCGPTSSWLISPLPGGASGCAIVFYVGFLQKWHAFAMWVFWWLMITFPMPCSSKLNWGQEHCVPFLALERCRLEKGDIEMWHLRSLNGNNITKGGSNMIQHHSAKQQRRRFPTTNCNHLRPDSWLPPVAWRWGTALLRPCAPAGSPSDTQGLEDVVSGFRMPEMDRHLWGLVEPLNKPGWLVGIGTYTT